MKRSRVDIEQALVSLGRPATLAEGLVHTGIDALCYLLDGGAVAFPSEEPVCLVPVADGPVVPVSVVESFLDSLTETEGYVEGEWDEYEALLEALGSTDDD